MVFQGILSIFYILSEKYLFLFSFGMGVDPPPLIGDMSPNKSSFLRLPYAKISLQKTSTFLCIYISIYMFYYNTLSSQHEESESTRNTKYYCTYYGNIILKHKTKNINFFFLGGGEGGFWITTKNYI